MMPSESPADGGRRTRVLIITGDLIGVRMAGPAIRVWHMALELSEHCDVRVVSWNRIERTSDLFELAHVHETDDAGMRAHERWADVIVVQGTAMRFFPSVRTSEKIIVADLYDPFQLEQLEQNKHEAAVEYRDEVTKAVSLLNEQLARADAILCATDRQRDLWLGGLSVLGRLNPATYSADPTFGDLLRIVPFGLPVEPPVQRRHGIRGVVPGIDADDVLLIWGGGIYNWFDPVTLVEAIGRLEHTHPRVKLFFLAARHFNPDIPEMRVVSETVEVADRLGLTGSRVFFNETWVDYETRADYLLDADIGVSTHFVHAETRFSFRTRVLDYLWAGLPVVTTEGDAFADLVAEQDLGAVVPVGDVGALADAIARLADDVDERTRARTAVAAARSAFEWPRALSPLVEFCTAPHHAADFGSASRAVRGGGRFERILDMPKGRRRDLALLRYYLGEGGVGLVRDKLGKRRERLSR